MQTLATMWAQLVPATGGGMLELLKFNDQVHGTPKSSYLSAKRVAIAQRRARQ
jgi:hypothetical protein